jgi:hypothetical protein
MPDLKFLPSIRNSENHREEGILPGRYPGCNTKCWLPDLRRIHNLRAAVVEFLEFRRYPDRRL